MSADREGFISATDFLWVVAQLAAGAADTAGAVAGVGPSKLQENVLGLPMDQTVRLPDGRYVLCVLMAGDADDFNRTHG